MTRLLLAPIALICLLAGLVPLGVASLAASRGLLQGLADPALAPSLHLSALLAATAACLGAALGLAGAAAIRAAARPGRLIVPAPTLARFPALADPALRDLARLACAAARAAALMLLVTTPAMATLRPGLRQAAMSAGATPLQAWRHAVLAPLWLPVCLGLAFAFLATMAQTPAEAILAPHLDLADAWIAPASLLLVACSAAALSLLAHSPAQR
jgi:ABC-type spermidine/putrescine transport system permease subunit II